VKLFVSLNGKTSQKVEKNKKQKTKNKNKNKKRTSPMFNANNICERSYVRYIRL